MNPLARCQTDAQRLIAKHIGGYPLWTAGDVHESRWPTLVEKFNAKYETDISPSARQWRKKRGQCCALLIGAKLPDGKIRWVLLVTEDGRGPVKEEEALRDARQDRLAWGDYVLIRSTRTRAAGGRTHWTWFMTPGAERREANHLTALAQRAATMKQPHIVAQYTDTLMNRPLHAGVRQQVAKMLRRAEKVWTKHASSRPWPGPDPAQLPHLGAYRKQADLPSAVRRA